MKILIAEDDFASRNFLQFLARKFGEVDIAVNGQEALDVFTESLKEGNPYNLIFMDIMMPLKNGLDAAREIRALEKEQGVLPSNEAIIIMTTALSDVKTVFEAFKNSQATDYIVKPFRVESVLNKLTELGIINE
ncbi:response regulator [Desulfovibrio gilichinskyi]|uniref:Two-component system, chemotaxis family, response regulator CheY n=1 Tax=Desulfovibrio gilichinskyi TaxID=1519643 RepID=A0A1X7CE21_9BACT|nr:response regulator [Desulfovibrio gilichinskyi]SME95073.1 two-component system, chemotaxis family, response regulator CheY [Desulfovibrio gilichinskyi]